MSGAEFDLHADTYDADLNQALSVSGEDKNYFARGRVERLAKILSQLGEGPSRILDYGCGIGDTSQLLQEAFDARRIIGVDISEKSISLAAQRNGNSICEYMIFEAYREQESIDLAYCNGVFHHIPLSMRDSAVDYVFTRLRPGGIFAFWENNPWNLGTRYVMSQCVFDHDAVMLPPSQAHALLQKCGFEIVRTDFCFFFPRFLKGLRFLEGSLSSVPFGGQYQILCRKPAH
jgi:SAM-dependent methyltransferase